MCTREQHTRKLKSMLEPVLMKQKRRCTAKDIRAYKGPECRMDHYPVKTNTYALCKREVRKAKMN